jgi:hypothetical protein
MGHRVNSLTLLMKANIMCEALDSVVVKAVCYKPEGAGSRPNEVNNFFFQLT